MFLALPPAFAKTMQAAALAAIAAMMGASAFGQARPSGDFDGTSKIDLYGGYGFWDPRSNVNGTPYDDESIYSPNATASLSYYFLKHLGVQIEGNYFAQQGSVVTTTTSGGITTTTCNTNPCNPLGVRRYTAQGGPVFRYPIGRLIPFVHALGGGVKLGGPVDQPLTWGWGATGGLGVDYVLPFFHNRVAVRPIQADYQYDKVSYGALVLPAGTSGGTSTITALKLSGGLVLRLGAPDYGGPHGGLMLGCDTQPSSVYPGDPIQIAPSPMNLNLKKPKTYTWASTGGRVTISPEGASISTVDLAPGDYTVTGTVKQGKAIAKCTANFTVKPFEPPVLTCSADPTTVEPGGVSTISSTGMSPANRSLSYSFSTDAGTLSGSGSKVQLATAGVGAATIHVTCNVTDDLGKTAQATTQVAVVAPPPAASSALPPPIAQSQTLCGVSFERDRKRPTRVDNEAKACLDDVALTMQRQADAKLVIVGNYGNGETATEGARRSLNVEQYLTDEKGIDAGRIQVRYGVASGRTVDDLLVPAGATFDDPKSTAFEPASVKRVGQAYGKPGQRPAAHKRRRRHHRAAAAPPVQ